MIEWKDISDSDLEQIAMRFKIDINILNRLMTEWYYYFFMGKNWHDYIDPEYYPEDRCIRTLDLALLSIFYHENKAMIKSKNPSYFEKVVFVPKNRAAEDLKLNSYFANQLVTSYLKKFEDWEIMNKEDAIELLAKEHRRGKRPEVCIAERDDLIKGAANFLKSNDIRVYAPVIKELLSKMDIALIETGTIRRIVNR